MREPYLKPLHTGISVRDMEESIGWYEKNLDFQLVSMNYIPPLKSTIAFLRHGNFEIELFCHDDTLAIPKERLLPNQDIQTQGTKHICFAHDDVVGLFERLRRNGVNVVLGPQVMEGEVMGYIQDCNGALIEFIERKI